MLQRGSRKNRRSKGVQRSQTLYKGKLFNLTGEAFCLPSGKQLIRETVRHPGSCAIVPLLSNQKVILIRQIRHSIQKTLWEIPAGTLERGERAPSCARRELIEETGYRAKFLKKLGTFYTSPGFCTEKMHLYVATKLSRLSQHLEEDETIQPRIFSLKTAQKMIRTGAIQDAKTIIGLSLL